MSLIRDLFTGTDNKRWELARVSFAVTLLVGLGTEIYLAFTKGKSFDLANWGIFLAGGGALIGIKDIANPMNRNPKTTVENVEHAEVTVNPT